MATFSDLMDILDQYQSPEMTIEDHEKDLRERVRTFVMELYGPNCYSILIDTAMDLHKFREEYSGASDWNSRLNEEVNVYRYNMPKTVDERIDRLKSSMKMQDAALDQANKRLKNWQLALVTMVSMLDEDDISEALEPKRSAEFLQIRELRSAMDWYAAANRDLLAENIQYAKEIEELKNAQSSKSE